MFVILVICKWRFLLQRSLMVLVEDQARAKIPNCSFDLPQDRKRRGSSRNPVWWNLQSFTFWNGFGSISRCINLTCVIDFFSPNFWSRLCCTWGHKSWVGGGDFLLDLFSTSQFVDCSYICIFIAAYIQIIRTAEGKTGGRSKWGGSYEK